MGMFLSKDPFEGVMTRSGSRNGYGYVDGNPVNYTDPSGKCIWDFCILELFVAGAVVAGVTAFAYDSIVTQYAVEHREWDQIDWGRSASIGLAFGVGGGIIAGVCSFLIAHCAAAGATLGKNFLISAGLGFASSFGRYAVASNPVMSNAYHQNWAKTEGPRYMLEQTVSWGAYGTIFAGLAGLPGQWGAVAKIGLGVLGVGYGVASFWQPTVEWYEHGVDWVTAYDYLIATGFVLAGRKAYKEGVTQWGRPKAPRVALASVVETPTSAEPVPEPVVEIPGVPTQHESTVIRTASGQTLAEIDTIEAETFYRTMSKADAEIFLKTGKMPPGSETFVSPTKSFSQGYDGELFEIKVKPGTLSQLEEIGVRNAAREHPLGNLPLVQKGWKAINAFFKVEGDQMNIGLGNGSALDIFNSSIQHFLRIKK